VGRVGVHDPSHDLFVRAKVGGHDIDLLSDERDHFLRVTAGQTLELAPRQGLGVAGDAAFRPAIRKTSEGALPTHPHGQGRDLAEGDLGMVAQAALGGAEGEMVLHPVAGKDFDPPVIAPQRKRDGHRAFRILEPGAVAFRQFEMVRHQVKLLAGHPERGMIVDVHGWNIKRPPPQIKPLLPAPAPRPTSPKEI
jgi:hypothetical protein